MDTRNAKSILAALLKAALPERLRESMSIGYHHWKTEAAIARTRQANRKAMDALLNRPGPIRLELGAGSRKLPGWTSIDNNGACDITMSLVDQLPFPDESTEEIYASHVLEHFHHPELLHILSECRRVLKPGGRLRLAVPDAKLYIRDYWARDMRNLDRYMHDRDGYLVLSPIDLVNLVAYDRGSSHEHGYMFDDEGTLALLNHAGFREAAIRPFDPAIDLEVRRTTSLFAEARK